MATLSVHLAICIFFSVHVLGNLVISPVTAANWCVARSDASSQALQTALDYACSAGADCSQLLSNGLCFLPNTIQAHASYAFNSYFQRKGMAPGSCDFAGTAAIARSDPSYGSCVYPSSLSTAGGTPATENPTPASANYPNTQTPPNFSGGSNGFNPGSPPTIPVDNSEASTQFMVKTTILLLSILLVISFTCLHIS